MKKAFVSYSQTQMEVVKEIEAALNVRGISTWRDVHDMHAGQDMEQIVRNAINDPNQVDAYILFATQNSLTSGPVVDWELSTALQRQHDDPTFPIFLYVQGISFNDIRDFSFKKFGLYLNNNLAQSIPAFADESTIKSAIRSGAQHMLKWKVRHLIETEQLTDDVLITLHTRERTAMPKEPHFEINLHNKYYVDGRKPTQSEWDTEIMPGFLDLKKALAEACGPVTIELQSKGHLSSAAGLGYAFRDSSGFNVKMEHGGKVWETTGSANEQKLLDHRRAMGDSRSKVAVLEIGVTHHEVHHAVTKFISDNHFDYRVRDTLKLGDPSRTSIENNQEALNIADQIAKHIKAYHQEFGADIETHVFYSGPLFLSLMIGHQLNACGKVRFYDWFDNSVYCPMAMLA